MDGMGWDGMGWSGCACVSGMLWNQFNAFSPICPGWSATIYIKQMAQNQQICDAMDGKNSNAIELK